MLAIYAIITALGCIKEAQVRQLNIKQEVLPVSHKGGEHPSPFIATGRGLTFVKSTLIMVAKANIIK